ncbi:MAG TPA: glycoside hydrolase 43 family protein [Lacipirellulaceae bacterium]|nr:glycoside hydrolase 43 family protein [Lacipirellulaceae bacterium]
MKLVAVCWLACALAASLVTGRPAAAQVPPKPAAWRHAYGDTGAGRYINPILPGDYCDIDAIRVGDDYYAITSTMHLSPGMAVLHSRDLVNWAIVGHAIDDVTTISPEMNWDRMNRYGRGVWAGAIRYHAGKYWIYFGAPDDGLFMTTADDPAGPWAPLHCLWRVSGWNDTCPFWDDDGQGYLVTTNFATDPANSRRYNVHLFKLSPDGRQLLRETDRIIHQSRGSEANKLDKRDGRYYHFYSEVRREGRVVMMNRATSLDGPWETRQLNHVNRRIDHEPNQGGIVQAPDGGWWFLTHQGSGEWEGRTLSLLPVTWRDDWPLLGDPGPDGVGVMTWSDRIPAPGGPRLGPQTSDEFDGPALGSQWQWNHQPRAGKWSLAESPGRLRLHAFPPLRRGQLMTAGNTLSQRTYRTARNVATAQLDLGGMAEGQLAGLIHFSRDHAAIGVLQSNRGRTMVHVHNGRRTEGPAIAGDSLWLRSEWADDGVSQFSYSTDGEQFAPLGPPYAAAFGHYRGDRIGLFTFNDAGEAGYVDAEWFRHEIAPSTIDPAASGPAPPSR